MFVSQVRQKCAKTTVAGSAVGGEEDGPRVQGGVGEQEHGHPGAAVEDRDPVLPAGRGGGLAEALDSPFHSVLLVLLPFLLSPLAPDEVVQRLQRLRGRPPGVGGEGGHQGRRTAQQVLRHPRQEICKWAFPTKSTAVMWMNVLVCNLSRPQLCCSGTAGKLPIRTAVEQKHPLMQQEGHSPFSQFIYSSPSNPGGHWQEYPLTRLEQVPPLRHGVDRHSSKS